MAHGLSVIHEDNHLLAVDKPAGVPTQPDESGDPSLLELGKEYLRATCRKTGNIYLAAAHRLDRPVSGVLLLAKTDKAAGRLAETFRSRAAEKSYEAVVELHRPPADGSWRLDADLEVDDPRGVRIFDLAATPGDEPPPARSRPDGRRRHAALAFAFRATWTVPGRTPRQRGLVDIRLITGVKHQIRAQLAACGWPVAGDFRYGPEGRRANPEPLAGGRAIALHARRLMIIHPVRKTPLELLAPRPGHFANLLSETISGHA